MARRTNITGIERLSIGRTKSGRNPDITLTRYTVNYKNDEGRPTNKSFYFGLKTDQEEAFLNAIRFMIEKGWYDHSEQDALALYRELRHDNLV